MTLARATSPIPSVSLVLAASLFTGCIYRWDASPVEMKDGDVTGVTVGKRPGHESLEALAGVTVAVRSAAIRRNSMKDGRFTIRNLPAGDHRLTFAWDENRDGVPELGVRTDVPIHIRERMFGEDLRPSIDLGEVTLLEPGTIRGTIRGDVQRDRTVVVVIDNPGVITVNADGSFQSPPLPPGKWNVVASGPHKDNPERVMLSSAVEVEVKEAQFTGIDLDVAEVSGNGHVHGEVIEPPEQTDDTSSLIRFLNGQVQLGFTPYVNGFKSHTALAGASFEFDVPVGLYIMEADTLEQGFLTVRGYGFRVGPNDQVPIELFLNLPQDEESGPCAGHIDLDGDGLCFMTAAEASGCVETCRDPSHAVSEPCHWQGVPVDCDDDSDGQLDLDEALGRDGKGPCHCGTLGIIEGSPTCEKDPSRADRDFDGICDPGDRFPNCEYNREPCAPASGCGDGTQQANEQCDDHNVEDDDGCRADCTRPPQLVLTTPIPFAVGAESNVEVRVTDSNGATLTGFTGTVVLTCDDPAVTNCGTTHTFVASELGQAALPLTLMTLGEVTITGWIDPLPVSTHTEHTVNVIAGAVDALEIVGVPQSWVAGENHTVTVRALDTLGNVATSTTGGVTLTSDDAQVQLWQGTRNFSDGTGIITVDNVELRTAGTRTLTATFNADTSIRATASSDVIHAAANQVLTQAPASVAVTEPFSVTAIVTDAYRNPVRNHSGSVSMLLNGSPMAGVSPFTFTGAEDGMHTFDGLVVNQVSTVQVTAHADGLQDNQAAVDIVPGPLNQIELTGPDTVEAGTPFNAAVVLKDALGNIATNYTGTLDLQVNGETVASHALVAADQGQYTFTNVAISKAGTAQLVAAAPGDVVSNTVSITVTVGLMDHFLLTYPSPVTAGVAFTMTVQAVDAYDNAVDTYAGTLAFEQSQAFGDHPPTEFSIESGASGQAIVSLVLEKKGPWTLTVKDLDNRQGTVLVSVGAGSACCLTFLSPTDFTEVHTDTDFTVSVAVTDVYRNAVDGVVAPVMLGLDGRHPALILGEGPIQSDNGVAQFDHVRIRTVGEFQLTATSENLSPGYGGVVAVDWAPPHVTATTTSVQGTCVNISYTVSERGNHPVDMIVEYSTDQTNWLRASMVGADPVLTGVENVGASVAGQSHLFRWNSSRDLPLFTGTAYLHLKAAHHDALGPTPPVELTVNLANGATSATDRSIALPTPRQIKKVLPADVNLDGRMDLVVLDGSNTVIQLLQETTGAFPSETVIGSSGVTDFAVADLTVDGIKDVVVVNPTLGTSGQLIVYRGDVASVFVPGTGTALPAGAKLMGLANINGGPGPDVLIKDPMQAGLALYVGESGSLSYSQRLFTTTTVTAMTGGRMSGGFYDDVLAADGSVSVAAMHGSEFTAGPAFSWPDALNPVQALAMGDVDLDGFLDVLLATESATGGFVLELCSDPDGNGVMCTSYNVGGEAPSELLIHDVDADGEQEIVFAQPGSSVILAIHPPDDTVTTVRDVGSVISNLAIADMDKDFRDELVVSTASSTAAIVIIKTMVPAPCYVTLTGTAPHATLPEPANVRAVGDFDGDGKPDVATASPVGTTVVVSLGAGNGEFFPTPLTRELGQSVRCMAAADMDGDGVDELVTCHNNTDNTNGTLAIHSFHDATPRQDTAPLGAPVGAMALADLNGDLELDLLALVGDGSSIPYALTTVLVKWGVVQMPQSLPGISQITAHLTAGDVDGDGFVDAVVGTQAGILAYMGNGDGTLTAGVGIEIGGFMTVSLTAGDFNGDGADEVFVYRSGGAKHFLRSDGMGGLTTTEIATITNDLAETVATDVDRDGVTDLLMLYAYSSGGADSIGVALGNPEMTLSMQHVVRVSGFPKGVGAADFTGDGNTDFVLDSGSSEAGLQVWPVTSFVPTIQTDNSANDMNMDANHIAVLDVNADGRSDVLAASNTDIFLTTLFTADAIGGWNRLTLNGIPAGATAAAAADVNGDGRDDVVVILGTTLNIMISGLGGLEEALTQTLQSMPTDVVVGDVNGDGNDEIVVGSGSGIQWLSVKNTTINSSPPVAVANLQKMALGDINLDGLSDLVVGTSTGLSMLMNRSMDTPGRFAMTGSPLSVGNVTAVTMADINADGRADVLYNSDSRPYVSYALGSAMGLISPTSTTIMGNAFTAGRVDDDPYADIVVADSMDNSVTIHLGSGTGNFTQWKKAGLFSWPTRVAIAQEGLGKRPEVLAFTQGGIVRLLQR